MSGAQMLIYQSPSATKGSGQETPFQVPGVPGFFIIRGSTGLPEKVISNHELNGKPYRITFETPATGYSSQRDIFRMHVNDHTKLYSEERKDLTTVYLDEPVVIWEPCVSGPETFRIGMLGKGLLVAYSEYAVAGFSLRYGCWFLNAIAPIPGCFVPLRLSEGLKFTITLCWSGRRAHRTNIIRKNETVPWRKDGIYKQHIIAPKQSVDCPSVVGEMFFDQSLRIQISTAAGRYILQRVPGGYAFKCANREGKRDSSYSRDFKVRRETHEVVPMSYEFDYFV